MTILPFVARTDPARHGALVVVASGSFRSPRGGRGVFSGCYRLERLLPVAGRVVAAGVFTGELTDGDGRRVGLGARRRTTPVDVSRDDGRLLVRIRAAQVDLLGLLVRVDELTLDLHGTPLERALRGAGPTPEGLGGPLGASSGPGQPAGGRSGVLRAVRRGRDVLPDHPSGAGAVRVPPPASGPLA